MNESPRKAATFVADVSSKFSGTAHLFRVDPPMSYEDYTPDGSVQRSAEHVVVSAAVVACETYIFPANADGDITDWGQLPGSFRGACDIDGALDNAGYEVTR